MGGLLRNNWLWALFAFALGAVVTWFLLPRRQPALPTAPPSTPTPTPAPPEPTRVPAEPAAVPAETGAVPAEPTLVPAEPDAVERDQGEPEPVRAEPAPAEPAQSGPARSGQPRAEPSAESVFSRRMDDKRPPEPTLFDEDPAAAEPEPAAVPPGRYGEGSADAVPHQGPPDGFTIKGNTQSMLFHTPDSPYYGRTRPQVWFRTEADAERAGFTKYTRRPRKSTDPRD